LRKELWLGLFLTNSLDQFRELKDISGLGKGVKLCSVPETAVLAGKSAVLLNEHRLRGTKGYRSANTLASEMPSWYTHVSRAGFYR